MKLHMSETKAFSKSSLLNYFDNFGYKDHTFSSLGISEENRSKLVDIIKNICCEDYADEKMLTYSISNLLSQTYEKQVDVLIKKTTQIFALIRKNYQFEKEKVVKKISEWASSDPERNKVKVAIENFIYNPASNNISIVSCKGFDFEEEHPLDSLPDIFDSPIFKHRLTRLKVNDTNITDLPGSIFQLNNLELLDISGNLLEVFPSNLESMTNLRKLNISSNKFFTISDHLKQLIEIFISRRQEFTLDLSCCGVSNTFVQKLTKLANNSTSSEQNLITIIYKKNPLEYCSISELYLELVDSIDTPRENFSYKYPDLSIELEKDPLAFSFLKEIIIREVSNTSLNAVHFSNCKKCLQILDVLDKSTQKFRESPLKKEIICNLILQEFSEILSASSKKVEIENFKAKTGFTQNLLFASDKRPTSASISYKSLEEENGLIDIKHVIFNEEIRFTDTPHSFTFNTSVLARLNLTKEEALILIQELYLFMSSPYKVMENLVELEKVVSKKMQTRDCPISFLESDKPSYYIKSHNFWIPGPPSDEYIFRNKDKIIEESLLEIEHSYDINQEGVAIFAGYVDPQEANHLIAKNLTLFKEVSDISRLSLHGKNIHRIGIIAMLEFLKVHPQFSFIRADQLLPFLIYNRVDVFFNNLSLWDFFLDNTFDFFSKSSEFTYSCRNPFSMNSILLCFGEQFNLTNLSYCMRDSFWKGIKKMTDRIDDKSMSCADKYLHVMSCMEASKEFPGEVGKQFPFSASLESIKDSEKYQKHPFSKNFNILKKNNN